MITGCANAILQLGYSGPVLVPVVSEHWSRRFLTRHPEYFICKQHTIDIDRKKAHQPDDIRDWFDRYESICNKYFILPEDIYNFDETGFRIGIGKDQWIIT